MQVNAIFETWHIADGNYPLLSVGDHVNLSFEVTNGIVTQPKHGLRPHFSSFRNGECTFEGTVLRKYEMRDEAPIAVIETGEFRFYVYGSTAEALQMGDFVEGRGLLAFDHYLWVEFLDDYEDPPDLFFRFAVRAIYRVPIPDHLVSHSASGKTWPTILPLGESSGIAWETLTTMCGASLDEATFIVSLDTAGLQQVAIPRTFR